MVIPVIAPSLRLLPRGLLEDVLRLHDPVTHALVERLRLDALHVRAHAHHDVTMLPRPLLGGRDQGPAHADPSGAGVHHPTGDFRGAAQIEEAALQDMDPARQPTVYPLRDEDRA